MKVKYTFDVIRVRLTDRQVEVLQNIALGLTHQEVAEKLKISKRTVEVLMIKICKKLNAKNSPHAVYMAFRNEILK